MGRGKLRMERITKEKDRNTTYRNRKNGIIKKAQELSVLCDVDTAIIIYPPGSNHPEIWPQKPDHIKNMITSYKEEKNEKRKRTYGLNDYFQDRKKKVEEELVRARERNLEAKYPTWFDDLNGLSEGQLRQFAMELENKKNAAKARLELIKKTKPNVQIPSSGFKLENNHQEYNHYADSSCPNLDQVDQTCNHDLMMMSHDHGWFDDTPYLHMLENNQPSNQYVGSYSYPSLDQVQTFNHNIPMSYDRGWFGDPYVASYTNFDEGGWLMTSHDDRRWFNDAPASTWSNVPWKAEVGTGFGYPVFEGDVVYDNSNSCAFQRVEQCCPDLALQDSHVNVNYVVLCYGLAGQKGSTGHDPFN